MSFASDTFCSDVMMPISKHRGKSIGELSRKDIEYFMDQEWFEEKYPKVYEAMEEELLVRERSKIDY